MANTPLSLYCYTVIPSSDINECDMEGSCHVNANCTDVPGNFTCVCDPGYTGDGFSNCTGRFLKHYIV